MRKRRPKKRKNIQKLGILKYEVIDNWKLKIQGYRSFKESYR